MAESSPILALDCVNAELVTHRREDRSAYPSSSLELILRNNELVMIGAATLKSMASNTIHRPSPESGANGAIPSIEGFSPSASDVRSNNQERTTDATAAGVPIPPVGGQHAADIEEQRGDLSHAEPPAVLPDPGCDCRQD